MTVGLSRVSSGTVSWAGSRSRTRRGTYGQGMMPTPLVRACAERGRAAPSGGRHRTLLVESTDVTPARGPRRRSGLLEVWCRPGVRHLRGSRLGLCSRRLGPRGSGCRIRGVRWPRRRGMAHDSRKAGLRRTGPKLARIDWTRSGVLLRRRFLRLPGPARRGKDVRSDAPAGAPGRGANRAVGRPPRRSCAEGWARLRVVGRTAREQEALARHHLRRAANGPRRRDRAFAQ